jgi:hypothetical protein
MPGRRSDLARCPTRWPNALFDVAFRWCSCFPLGACGGCVAGSEPVSQPRPPVLPAATHGARVRSLPPLQVPHDGRGGCACRARPDDPVETERVTRLGAFLRRARFDELPQALNVLRGEMSLIGPRPDDLPHAHAFLADIPGYRTALCRRPGISGLAQVELGYVHGRAGACQKTKIDLHYIRHAGLRLDARVLAYAQDRRRPQGAVTPRGPKTPWPSPRRRAIRGHKPRRTGM